MTDCLSIPLILQGLLQKFSTTDLLQLSLVNKQWNYEARSLMRKRGNLSAIINKNKKCQDLTAFASDLRRMKEMNTVVPFTGLTISFGGSKCDNIEHCQQSPSNAQLDPVYEEIIDGLTWKYLSVRFRYGWEAHKSCPGFQLLTKLLASLASVLEELSISIAWSAPGYCIHEFLQDCSFTRLKTFRLQNEAGAFTELIQTVVARAPNLQVFYSAEKVELEENLLEGSSAVHVTDYPYSPSTDEFPEDVVGELRMKAMDLLSFGPDFTLDKFNRITRTLLHSSRTTLSAMQVDVVFLLPLMVYGICLENVRTFVLGFSNYPLEFEKRKPEIWRLAKCFDFTRIFPKLNTVSVVQHDYGSERIPNEFYEMIAQGKACESPASDNRAINIKQLKLEDLPARVFRRRSSFRLLAQMFPDIQKLSIETTEIPFADLRDIWLDLKEVDLALRCFVSNLTNLDSVFCGIFPEEVAQLREQDEEYLQRVNIVPVMRSVAYLKELRNFTVFYNDHDDIIDQCYGVPYAGPTDDPTVTFSKVAGIIAFQRLPNVAVTFKTKEKRLEQALRHLKPYASVVYKERTRRS